jgi:hypothetical protein
MSPAAEQVIERLDAARQKWWFFSLMTTTVLMLAASVALLLAFMAADAVVQFSQRELLSLCLTWLAITGVFVILLARRLLRGQRTLEATARRVEIELPEIGSHLINLVQLSEDQKNINQVFCQAAVNEAAAKVGSVTFSNAASKQSRWKRFRCCMQTPYDLIEAIVVLALVAIITLPCSV